MPRVIADGEVKIQWVPTISNEAAPTTAEIGAGTELTGFLASLDTPLEGNTVNTPDLSTAFRTQVAGKFGGGATGQFYRDDTSDTAWDLLPRLTQGYIVIRRFGGSTVAFAGSDEVEVWPLEVITRSPATLDEESVQMFTVNFATTGEPTLDAVVT